MHRRYSAGLAQQGLAQKDLLPSRHLVDARYVEADLLVSSWEEHQVELFGPPRGAKGGQLREAGYDHSQFHVDWARQRAICLQGKLSTYWREYEQMPYKRPS